MEFKSESINDQINRITLAGRMDFAGTSEIDLKFTAYTSASHCNVVVDMTGVEFIASIGIRTLVTNAKALNLKEKQLVLFGLQEPVHKVLDAAGILGIIKTYDSEAAAIEALSA